MPFLPGANSRQEGEYHSWGEINTLRDLTVLDQKCLNYKTEVADASFVDRSGDLDAGVESIVNDYDAVIKANSGYHKAEIDFEKKSSPMVFTPVFSPISVYRCNPPVTRVTEAETPVFRNTRPPKHVPGNPSFFTLWIHSKATRPIVLENNTGLNGSTADLQVPYQPQGSLVRGETWIALPT
ncbi:UNVERIFIED_CONTAM: hypothetical protein FKN15_038224 [Acipenser sinensis]